MSVSVSFLQNSCEVTVAYEEVFFRGGSITRGEGTQTVDNDKKDEAAVIYHATTCTGHQLPLAELSLATFALSSKVQANT